MIAPFPTADIVAVAIVAASRETGANPLRVASGQRDAQIDPMRYETSRARAYAAMALKASTGAGVVAIGRMVGSGQPDVYLTGIAKRVATKKHAWWSALAMERVCEAVAEYRSPSISWHDIGTDGLLIQRPEPPTEPTNAPAPPPAPNATAPAPRPPRPAASPGKHNLTEMLRDAVATTQSMTPPPEEQ